MGTGLDNNLYFTEFDIEFFIKEPMFSKVEKQDFFVAETEDIQGKPFNINFIVISRGDDLKLLNITDWYIIDNIGENTLRYDVIDFLNTYFKGKSRYIGKATKPIVNYRGWQKN